MSYFDYSGNELNFSEYDSVYKKGELLGVWKDGKNGLIDWDKTLLGDSKMTMLERLVKERNEALFSLDRKKIEAFMTKYGQPDVAEIPDDLFWASIYKAICGISEAPDELVSKALMWLHKNGYANKKE